MPPSGGEKNNTIISKPHRFPKVRWFLALQSWVLTSWDMWQCKLEKYRHFEVFILQLWDKAKWTLIWKGEHNVKRHQIILYTRHTDSKVGWLKGLKLGNSCRSRIFHGKTQCVWVLFTCESGRIHISAETMFHSTHFFPPQVVSVFSNRKFDSV